MIAADLQPLSIVEEHGFLNYSSLLDPWYQPPSRTIARRILPEKYEEVRGLVKTRLTSATSGIAVTTDIWSSRQAMSYCCLTAHAISESWELESYVLETFNFNTDHTARHIAQELKRVVEDWELSNSISCCVTDNASNMLAGIREAGWRHLPCFAHTLNLVVQEAIKTDPVLSHLQSKCKSIVSHFHRSTKASEKLRSVQQQLSLPELKLIQDVVTRWNSTYLMFEIVISQHEALTTTLCLMDKADMCLSTEEKNTIEKSLVLLEPFLQATENISGDKYVSISMIIPLTKLLTRSCVTAPESPLRRNIILELKKRFNQCQHIFAMAVGTLLDPRFKKIGFTDNSAVDMAVGRVQGEVKDMIDSEAQNRNPPETPQTQQGEAQPERNKKKNLWAAFDDKVAEATSHRTSGTDSFVEFKRYFEERVADRKEDLLVWWKENGARFPHLSVLARKYLAIPGSSVPSERLFSKAGELVSAKRSRLKPKNIDTMLFLNKNLPIVHTD